LAAHVEMHDAGVFELVIVLYDARTRDVVSTTQESLRAQPEGSARAVRRLIDFARLEWCPRDGGEKAKVGRQ
jgi:hypothetical protein